MKLILLLVACCGTACTWNAPLLERKCRETSEAMRAVGATVGIYAVSGQSCRDHGWIDVDWFRVAEPGSRLCR